MNAKHVLGLMIVLAAAAACSGNSTGPEEEARPVLLGGLGDHSFPITTSEPRAQRYFDQALALTYGFNHDAAGRSFREASRIDPACAMCSWGTALALGPNINAPMGPDAARAAWAAVQEAERLTPMASDKERALIEALVFRYAQHPPEDRASLDLAYAMAMREVQRLWPDDVDVATLYAESLMDLMPWNYWTADAQPREHTREVVELLESVIEREPEHLGANHYYIHATEEFYPEKAEPSADRLGKLAPEAGHLVHMPSHIYWRVGRYEDAAEINKRAAAADEAFFATCRAGAFYRAVYYPHNIHFLWAAASAEGQSQLALTTARKLAAKTRAGMQDFAFLEEFVSIPILTLVRFGQWDAVLGEPAPVPERVYLTGIHHYARGLAYTRRGRLDEARAELAALRETASRPDAEGLTLAGGTASARTLLDIGDAHLDGEIEAASGNREAAIASLRRAVAQQDELVYMEPPPWFFPTRQALGAVLLDAGRSAEAETVYREDLEAYPKNGWSLFGLSRSFGAQGEEAKAAWARQGFENAWARADVELEASRF
jgi:tetratricopeptide (TPR) repeat protein